MSHEGLFRWWDVLFLVWAVAAFVHVNEWRGEAEKDKRRGNELAGEASRNILWEGKRALFIVLGVWLATLAFRVLF
jgi:hypothetical protein